MTLAALSRAPVYLPSDGSAQVTEARRCGDTPVFMFDDVQLSFEDGSSLHLGSEGKVLTRHVRGSTLSMNRGLAGPESVYCQSWFPSRTQMTTSVPWLSATV